MKANIKKIVNVLIQNNFNIDDKDTKDTKDTKKCIKKTIMFEHEKIDKLLNNITISNLFNYSFININRFNLIYQYPTIDLILKIVVKLMNTIKDMVYPMYMEYNKLLNTFYVKDDKIIINRFNLYYFYKLVLNVLKNINILKKTIDKMCNYIKNNFLIDDNIFDKNKLINTHKLIKINLHDLNTKLEDIY